MATKKWPECVTPGTSQPRRACAGLRGFQVAWLEEAGSVKAKDLVSSLRGLGSAIKLNVLGTGGLERNWAGGEGQAGFHSHPRAGQNTG